MILRRRDDYARVIRDLGGSLFATEGQVDEYFIERGDNSEFPASDEEIARLYRMWQSIASFDWKEGRIAERVQEHIRTAPDREAVALRRANIRQACLAPHLKGEPR